MKKMFVIVIIFLFMGNMKALDISATSVILMDTDNNIILYEKNIHSVRSVASISKIMTAVLAIESGHLDDIITVDDVISKAYGSAIYIQVGEELSLRDLVYGLMLRSGNDAALVIAKYVGGSVEHFVEMMNNKASEIGMKDSLFNNPHGLDADKGNYSTAYDMAILTSYAMKLPEYKKITGTKTYSLKTNKTRRTLVTTASYNNINLVVVTLNDGNDFEDHINMFKYGFDNYTNYEIIKKGNIHIYEDSFYEDYQLYTDQNFSYLINNQEKMNILLKFELEKKRMFKEDDQVGSIIVKLGDQEIHKQAIYIKEKDKRKKSFLSKAKEWFENIW